MSQYIYLWDTAQFPDLKAGADSSLKQATKDFERLKTTAVDAISPNILELGKRLTAEATTLGYSDVFIDSYLNAENDIAYQPKFGAVAIGEPDTSALDPFGGVPIEALFNSEVLRVIRPIAKELGLVIYDIRGGVYYPDGSIYPAKLAKAVEKQDKLEREISENAHLYQPNAKLPSKREDFQKLFVPLLNEQIAKWGFKLSEIKNNQVYFTKITDFGEIVWRFEITGSHTCFTMSNSLTYKAPKVEQIYSAMNEKIEKFAYDSLGFEMLGYKSLNGGKQEEILTELIPKIMESALYLKTLNSYTQIFERRILKEGQYDFDYIETTLLAKLADNEKEYKRLINSYPDKIDKRLIGIMDNISL